MSLTASEIWTRLLDRARQELPEQTFRTWLEPTRALDVEGQTIFVGTPDQFAADWNETKHAGLLASYGPVAVGHPVTVVFRVTEDAKRRSQMDLFVAPPAGQVATQAHQKPANTSPLSERYTFEHFVVGNSNQLAYAAANAVAQAPGKVYNPLFIYGDTGLGKTHLMQ